jgi:hypothetical protein
MTAPTTAPAHPVAAHPAGSSESVDTAAQPGCPACPHPMAEHDPIGVRFCAATEARALDRGCVCRIG